MVLFVYFISYEKNSGICWAICLAFCKPKINCFKRALIRNVKNKNNSSSWSIVASGQWPKCLRSCSVPNHDLNFISVAANDFAKMFNSQCRLILIWMYTIDKLIHNGCFPYANRANKNYLKNKLKIFILIYHYKSVK